MLLFFLGHLQNHPARKTSKFNNDDDDDDNEDNADYYDDAYDYDEPLSINHFLHCSMHGAYHAFNLNINI